MKGIFPVCLITYLIPKGKSFPIFSFLLSDVVLMQNERNPKKSDKIHISSVRHKELGAIWDRNICDTNLAFFHSSSSKLVK